MTSARTINAQHPKNVGVVVQTMERRLNLLEAARKMV
jgi:hypothetical protein